MRSFPRQSRSRGGRIATTCKCTLGSNITFKTNFDFTHTSFDVVQTSITLQHNTLHFSVCTALHPTDKTILLTPCLLNSCLTILITHTTSQDLLVVHCLVGDTNIHFDNPLKLPTKLILTTLSLRSLVQVINSPTHNCCHIIDWIVIRPVDDIHKKSTVAHSLESDHYFSEFYLSVPAYTPSTIYRTVRKMANIDRSPFIAELSSASEFSPAEKANLYCERLGTVLSRHEDTSL